MLRRRLSTRFSWAAAALAALATLQSSLPAAIAADCPLDLSWPNYTLIASVCADQNGHSKCCRYINALLAVSSALYANTTGTLGVPAEFSDVCLSNISHTLVSKGILPAAASFCGLGLKIQVSYQCVGMNTVLQMSQSPNFSDVTRSCAAPLSDDVSCKRCLNTGLSYLRHLVGELDNVTLNTCRDAAFIAFASQGNNISTVDTASCFFSVQGLGALQVNSSVRSPAALLAPAISPSPLSVQIPGQHLTGMPLKDHHSYKLALFPAIGVLVTGLAILLLIVLILLIRRKSKELEKIEGTHPQDTWNASSSLHTKKGQEGTSTIFRRFSYKEMRKATGNSSAVLGRGEKGVIFKGQLNNGSVVAVRRIDSSLKQGQQDFCREMELLGRLHHRHLVALKGFCFTKFQRFQVYEYMENGSLKDHLHLTDKPPLAWQTRIQIAIDIANALEYLHFYCYPPLYHGDVKPSNILLDKNFVAKLAGYGLAHYSRSGNINSTLVNVKIQATPGYIDPEYVVTQELTSKSDVYSYGVLLLELVTGKPVIHDNRNLVEWSRELIGTDYRLHELVDPVIADAFDLDELQVMVDVIHWCIHKEGNARPSMKQVLRILYERLDPMFSGFARTVEGEEGYYYGEQSGRKGKEQKGDVIPFSGDARCLQSSSSTSRSYCSRSVLLECNSPEPQSPRGIFLV